MAPPWLLAILIAQATPQGAPSNDWPSYNRTLASDRFSPLTQITADNVARLRQVCMYDTKEQVSLQTGPLVVNGIMYFTTDTMTYAIDAGTCALKWKQRTPHQPTYLQVNRGVAYDNGRLFRGAGAGYLLAIDAATGRTLWNVPLGTLRPGESAPMAPLAWNGLVFIGNAGGDSHSVTGQVHAIDQRDGRIVWTFDVVPDTGKVRETWHNAPDVPPTGGAFWTSFGLDTAQRVLYVPAGNPAPDFIPELRPGSNLLTNSVIGLDAPSGRLLGYFQIVRYDLHDWDVSAAPVVLTTRSGRATIASANKDGLLSMLDRSRIRTSPPVGSEPGALPLSHGLSLLRQIPVTTRENTDVLLTPHAPVRFCPGSQGGNEWNGPAYYPPLNLLIVGAADWCYTVQQAAIPSMKQMKPGDPWGGDVAGGFGAPDSASKAFGWITAVDADSGTVLWRVRTPRPLLAGITPTAGGVIFTGELSGDVIALNPQTGAVLWRQSTGNSIGGGVITYQARGKQLVAVAAGMKSPIWPTIVQSNRIVVFGLP
jgi:alcohol dehydrogenase (cytochrome c)